MINFNSHPHEPIAIVGLGCRFPGGVDSPATFWRLLQKGADAITEIPADRPELRRLYDPTPGAPGKIITTQGGFLSGLEKFDAHFFEIAPREARHIDPQQRLLLETAWEAFEDAGIAPRVWAGRRGGVFIGMWTNEYEDRMQEATDNYDLYIANGGGRHSASGRLNYFFDLQGPSLTLDTACSSSLVTVHLACQSLRSHESDIALAGGVNLMLKPYISVGYSRSKMLSPEGRCKFGDASANGYVRSEGCGMVLLKRLSDALAAGDRIYALIRGSAVNNDGQSSGQLVAPGVQTQHDMLYAAYDNAGIAPHLVQYIEAHGTGTAVGDPVELEALSRVLAANRSTAQPCWIGSVKTNIGHAEAASGIAGLIKLALCLQHRALPASLHCNNPNPKIKWDEWRFKIPQRLMPWPEVAGPLYAGVNSFGVTGTNAHLVLEGAESEGQKGEGREQRAAKCLLALSAKTENALRALAEKFEQHLAENAATALLDTCCSAATTRATLTQRLALVAASREEMREKLAAFTAGNKITGVIHGQVKNATPPKPAFLFTGQGAQYMDMGRELYETQPVFRAALQRCDEILRPHLERSLLEVLYPALIDDQSNTPLAPLKGGIAEVESRKDFPVKGGIAEVESRKDFPLKGGIAKVESRKDFPLKGGIAKVESRKDFPLEGGIAKVESRKDFPLEGGVAKVESRKDFPLEGGIAGMESREKFPIKEEIAAVASHKDFSVDEAMKPAHSQEHSPLEGGQGGVNATPTSNQQHATSNQQPATSNQHPATSNEQPATSIHQTAYTQPALFALEYALAELWRAWGIEPTMMFGHSVGEYVAACLAGVFSLEDGLKLIAARGRLMQALPHGGVMAAVFASKEKIAAALTPFRNDVAIAAYNGPENIVISGREEAVQAVLARLHEEGIKSKALVVSHAFHSPLMEPMLDEFERIASTITFHAPCIPLVSNVSGRVFAEGEIPDAKYWREHVRAAVRFEEGIQTLHGLGCNLFLEIGPNPTLSGMGMRCLPEGVATWLPSLSQGKDDEEQLLKSLGACYIHGLAPNWNAIFDAPSRRRVKLPLYPFQRERYWIEENVMIEDGGSMMEDRGAMLAIHDPQSTILDPRSSHPLLGKRLRSALQEIQFENRVHANSPAFLNDYRLHDMAVFPAAAYIEMALAAAQKIFGASRYRVREFTILEMLFLPEKETQTLQLIVEPANADDARFQILRLKSEEEEGAGNWIAHAAGKITRARTCLPATFFNTQAVQARCREEISGADFYQSRFVLGESVGPQWRVLDKIWRGNNEALARLQWLEQEAHAYVVPPVLLEASMQLLSAGLATTQEESALLGPAGFETFEIFQPMRGPVWCHAELRATQLESATRIGEVHWYDDNGACLGRMSGLVLKHVHNQALQRKAPPAEEKDLLYEMIWEPQALGATPENAARSRGSWLICADRGGLGAQLAEQLRERGEYCVTVFARETAGAHAVSAARHIDPMQPEEFASIFREVIAAPHPPLKGIVHLWSLDTDTQVETSASTLLAAQALTCGSVLHLVQALHRVAENLAPCLWLIMQSARAIIPPLSGARGLLLDQEKLSPAKDSAARGNTPRTPLKGGVVEGDGITNGIEQAQSIPPLRGARGVLLDQEKFSPAKDSAARGNTLLTPLKVGIKDGINIVQAPLWGMARVLGAEHPELRTVCIALGAEGGGRGAESGEQRAENRGQRIESNEQRATSNQQPATSNQNLLHEILHNDGEEQVAFHDGLRHVARLVRKDSAANTNITSSGQSPFTTQSTIHDPRSTILITGGLGGLGLNLAQWLVAQGARHLALMSRSAPSPQAEEKIHALRAHGAQVLVAHGDVAVEEDAARVLAEIKQSMPPLRGLIHAAGVMKNKMLLQQSWEDFAPVMAPKIAGAWHLHKLTQDLQLDYFILFSSIASVLGFKGQSNYAAANAFLDAFAHWRSACGMKTLSLNWGPWAEAGMAVALGDREGQRLQAQGIDFIGPEQGWAALAHALERNDVQTTVLPINWQTYAQQFALTPAPKFLERLLPKTQTPASSKTESSFAQRLQNAPPEKREDMLLAHVREHTMAVLGLPPSQRVEINQPLREMGLDSLMTVELRNALSATLGRALPGSLVFDYPTIAAIANFLAEKVFAVKVSAASVTLQQQRNVEEEQNALAHVQQLDEEEAEALLLDKLAALEERL